MKMAKLMVHIPFAFELPNFYSSALVTFDNSVALNKI